MSYTVYKHTSPSGKVYIGITSKKPENRWQKGFGYIGNEHFFRAIQKYGWDNFAHEIISEGLTKEEAEAMEIDLIAFYDSTNEDKGYNVSTGGENHFAGYHHSEETKKKIGDAQRGTLNHMYGKTWKMSDEGRKRISDARTGMKFTEEHCKNISKSKSKENHPNYGKHLSESTKDKIAKRNSKAVICIDTGCRYESIKQARIELNIPNAHIGDVCNGKLRTTCGLRWKWDNDNNQNQRVSRKIS